MRHVRLLRLILLCVACAVHGCATAPAPAPADLSVDVLKNLAYIGISEDGSAMKLRDGRWEGEPPEPGSAAVPTLDFSGERVARGLPATAWRC